jgi:hypothetical protein
MARQHHTTQGSGEMVDAGDLKRAGIYICALSGGYRGLCTVDLI